jgi:hypothetical protein
MSAIANNWLCQVISNDARSSCAGAFEDRYLEERMISAMHLESMPVLLLVIQLISGFESLREVASICRAHRVPC